MNSIMVVISKHLTLLDLCTSSLDCSPIACVVVNTMNDVAWSTLFNIDLHYTPRNASWRLHKTLHDKSWRLLLLTWHTKFSVVGSKCSMIDRSITLFRSITILCGIDNIMRNVPHIQSMGIKNHAHILYTSQWSHDQSEANDLLFMSVLKH